MGERLTEDQLAARLERELSRIDELVTLTVADGPGAARLQVRFWGEPGARRATLTRFEGKRQTGQETLLVPELAARARELAAAPHASWELVTTTDELHARRAKRAVLLSVGRKPGAPREAPREHDRARSLLLDPADPTARPLLRALGLASEKGHVLPGREKKLRQVERFVRFVVEAQDALPEPLGGPLEILDAGCGAAYLTFALHHVLSRRVSAPGRVTVHGVDVRDDVIEGARAIARELGVEADVRFTRALIRDVPQGPPPSVVLCLHACDTATDEALAHGVHAGAPLVLAAPCCQHELHGQLEAPALSPVLRHGILRERLADLATDALRALLLRGAGYRTDVVEFVDPEATPKNLLIRAVRTRAPRDERWAHELLALKGALGIRGELALERLLAERRGPS